MATLNGKKSCPPVNLPYMATSEALSHVVDCLKHYVDDEMPDIRPYHETFDEVSAHRSSLCQRGM